MFVLSDAETGYSDESMRFATRQEMNEYTADRIGWSFNLRIED